ncbi:helix-turn-helix transcriptional regulator [Pararhizobium polonicum]|nr:helix-turn-helix transcriptional regulator [Pararhizobium polonicum]
MAACTNRKNEFIDNTFDMLGRTLGASSLAFYSVDGDYNLYDFRCSGVPREFFRLYLCEMHKLDPLHVRRVASRPDRVVRMQDAPTYMEQGEIDEYKRFLRRYDFIENIDILFRSEGEIKAGLSVIWREKDRRPIETLHQLANDLQPFIEYALWTHVDMPKGDPMIKATKTFHLTPRESEVVKLLCFGRTNADIATCLGIGVSTVKTHLIRIFDKTGVETRAGVVARFSAFS